MAVLPAWKAGGCGYLDAREDSARSGLQNPARFSRPDLAVLHRPSHALGLCSRRGSQAVAKLFLGPQLPSRPVYPVCEPRIDADDLRPGTRQLTLRVFLSSSHLLSWSGFP